MYVFGSWLHNYAKFFELEKTIITPAMGGVGKFGGWGGVKFRIFTLSYNAQFWSYDNVVNMFLVRFELKKHLRTLSEHSKHFPRFLVDLKLPHGVKQTFSRNSPIFRS